MNTIASFLISSALYALIPAIILAFGASALGGSISIVLITIFLSGIIGIPLLFFNKKTKDAALDSKLIFYAHIATAGIFGFYYFMHLAIVNSNPLYALVISESWPILSALLFPMLGIGLTKRLGLFGYFVGFIALAGLMLVSIPQVAQQQNTSELKHLMDSKGLVLPILAMICMTFAATFKALHTQRAKMEFDTNAVKSFILSYTQMIPLALVILFVEKIHLPLDWQFSPFALGIALINMLSAIIFSFGTLAIKRSTDLFIWFFTPVFSVLFYCLITLKIPHHYEAAGIGLVVGSNLLASLETEKRQGYRYCIISLMLTGTLCVVLPRIEMMHYYDALAVLTVFLTITLAFMLERVSSRSVREAELISDACRIALENGKLSLAKELEVYFRCSDRLQLKRQLRRISGITQDAKISANLGLISASRMHGLTLSNLFSISISIIAVFILVVLCRPEGWQHDLVALAFIPSVVYGLFYLVDLNNQRYTPPYTVFVKNSEICLSFDLLRKSDFIQNSIWSVLLIIFLFFCFGLAFVANELSLISP